jgi:anti-sigma factor RsiW
MKVSTKRPTDMDLMMYADGELDGDAARAVAAWLGQDADARAVVESLRQVGEAVRTYVEIETDAAEVEVPAFAQLWDRIERRVHANGHAEPARPEPVKAPAPRKAPRREPQRAGMWASIRRWFEDHRGHVLSGAVSAGAVAALMLAVGPRERVIEHQTTVRSGGVVSGGTPAVLRSEPPEVEELEVYEGSGTVLTIEPDDEDDSAAAVIWISNDDAENTEGPI